MSWILDIIILAIIAITIILAVKRGFVRTAISAGSFIVAIILTSIFASPVSEALAKTDAAESVQDSIQETIAEEIKENANGVDGLFEGESKEFNRLVEFADLDMEDLEEAYNKNEDNVAKSLAKKIAKPIINIITTIIAVIIIFIVSYILLSLLAKVLDKICNLPILRSFNKVFGAVLGVILAVVRVCLFCFVAGIVIEFGTLIGNDFLMSFDPNDTLLFDLFSNINIFAFFI